MPAKFMSTEWAYENGEPFEVRFLSRAEVYYLEDSALSFERYLVRQGFDPRLLLSIGGEYLVKLGGFDGFVFHMLDLDSLKDHRIAKKIEEMPGKGLMPVPRL